MAPCCVRRRASAARSLAAKFEGKPPLKDAGSGVVFIGGFPESWPPADPSRNSEGRGPPRRSLACYCRRGSAIPEAAVVGEVRGGGDSATQRIANRSRLA